MATSSEPPTYKLHAPWSIGFATLLGTVLAGAILLALNYRCLGKNESAFQSLAIGLGISLLLMSFTLIPSMPKHLEWLGLVQALLAVFIAKWLQGKALAQHITDGGSIASIWACAGAAVLSVAIILLTTLLGYSVGSIFSHNPASRNPG